MSTSQLPLAVVGMPGAGKSEVTNLLVELQGFERVYFGQVVLDELARRDLVPGPDAERLVREQLRASEGMDVMAARSLPRIREALASGRRVCIDGLYSRAEWERLAQETGVITLAVHAPRWLRKSRLAKRSVRPLTGTELDARDLAEVDRLQKADPIALADAHVVNDGSLDDLRDEVGVLVEHLACLATSRMRI